MPTVLESSFIERQTQPYRDLFRDVRLYRSFQAALSGILASGSTRLSQMARSAPGTGAAPHAERRLRRLVHHEHQRADVRPTTLEDRLTTLGAQRLAGQDEVVVVMDGSDLRKPHSQALEHRSTVRTLEGGPVSGYRALNAIGLTPDGRRALLYHTLYSPKAPGFTSANTVIIDATLSIVQALRAAGVGRIIVVLDRGFDDLKLIRLLMRLQVQFVIRVKHVERTTRLTPTGVELPLVDAAGHASVQDQFEMKRPVVTDGKVKWRPTPAQVRSREVFVDGGRVRLNVVKLEFTVPLKNAQEHGWLLLTNVPTDAVPAAGAVVRLYLRRWSIEEVFSWTTSALGWEQLQVLDVEALRTLVALAWTAASFVFDLAESLDSPQLQLLAHLGGYVPHKNRPPGKKILLLGLLRLANAYLVAHSQPKGASPDLLDALLYSFFARR